jgi:hypothetical protein
MPSVFAGRSLPDMNKAAQQGLQASFAVIGYKGRNWRIKYRGNDELLRDASNRPLSELEVVIVGISPHISKQFYNKRYQEGDAAPPDCFSVKGDRPDPASPDLQCPTCAACPQNVWGSRITDSGKKAKACQDSRRIAVVPYGDIANEAYGGPMLLRIPPMSLANLAKYTNKLDRYGAQPYMVRTMLRFDYDVAYPLIVFQEVAWLDEDAAHAVAEVIEEHATTLERMFDIPIDEVKHDPAEPADTNPLAIGGPAAAFSAPGSAPKAAVTTPAEAVEDIEAAKPKPKPKPPLTPTPAPQPAPAPQPEPPPVAAQPEPEEKPASAPPKRRASGFNKPKTDEEPAPRVVNAAPPDMEQAIDELLT